MAWAELDALAPVGLLSSFYLLLNLPQDQLGTLRTQVTSHSATHCMAYGSPLPSALLTFHTHFLNRLVKLNLQVFLCSLAQI